MPLSITWTARERKKKNYKVKKAKSLAKSNLDKLDSQFPTMPAYKLCVCNTR